MIQSGSVRVALVRDGSLTLAACPLRRTGGSRNSRLLGGPRIALAIAFHHQPWSLARLLGQDHAGPAAPFEVRMEAVGPPDPACMRRCRASLGADVVCASFDVGRLLGKDKLKEVKREQKQHRKQRLHEEFETQVQALRRPESGVLRSRQADGQSAGWRRWRRRSSNDRQEGQGADAPRGLKAVAVAYDVAQPSHLGGDPGAGRLGGLHRHIL